MRINGFKNELSAERTLFTRIRANFTNYTNFFNHKLHEFSFRLFRSVAKKDIRVIR
jgi:hypothetical protein